MTDKFHEKTLATERKYTGKIISVDLLDIELPDGRKAKREVIRHENAVAIVARRPDGKFVFVKQYRKAAEEAELSDAPHAQDQDPDENVYPVVMSFDEVEDAIRNGTIFDAKTLSACLMYKLSVC